jgi:hypothetical protein
MLLSYRHRNRGIAMANTGIQVDDVFRILFMLYCMCIKCENLSGVVGNVITKRQ